MNVWSEIYDTTIQDVKYLFKLKKEMDETTAKDIINLFRLNKENKSTKDRITRDIRIHFEHGKEDYYKPVKAGKLGSNNYIEYETNNDRNKTLEEYLSKIKPYSKDIKNDLKNLIQGN